MLAMAALSVATWNLNNRAGKRQFRPETADAAIALARRLGDLLVGRSRLVVGSQK
jgi:hypothetical protein